MTERFASLLNETEELLEKIDVAGVADRLDRLAVMLGMEAMLFALKPADGTAKTVTGQIYQVEKFFQFHYAEEFD